MWEVIHVGQFGDRSVNDDLLERGSPDFEHSRDQTRGAGWAKALPASRSIKTRRAEVLRGTAGELGDRSIEREKEPVVSKPASSQANAVHRAADPRADLGHLLQKPVGELGAIERSRSYLARGAELKSELL